MMMVGPICFATGYFNYTICGNGLKLIGTFNGKNLVSYTQSAGNPGYTMHRFERRVHLRSASETTRVGSYDFDEFYRGYEECFGVVNKSVLTVDWLNWFIGFAEGDGAILRHQDRASFVLTQKELQILESVKCTLNFGYTRTFNSNTSFSRFFVTKTQHLVLLFTLFNGNLRIEYRLGQLSRWADLFKLPLNRRLVSVSLLDGWLSGLVDAEACFNVLVIRRRDVNSAKPVYRTRLRFILDQKDAKVLLSDVCNLFKCGYVSLRLGTDGVFRYWLTSVLGFPRLIDYLSFYRLKTKKLNSFETWLVVYYMILRKEHLTDRGLMKINKLRRQMNKENSLLKPRGSSLRKPL